jgi:hypothetical protein
MNEVSPELAQALFELRPKAIKQKIEAKIGIHADRDGSAFQLQPPELPFALETVLSTLTHVQEWMPAPVRERGQFTPGARTIYGDPQRYQDQRVAGQARHPDYWHVLYRRSRHSLRETYLSKTRRAERRAFSYHVSRERRSYRNLSHGCRAISP